MVPAEDAVSTLWRDRATVVEEWPNAFFRSTSMTLAVPKVIALRTYAPIHNAPKFCRRSILLRDRYRCQYCGERFESPDLTFDHVIPRSAGGKTEWTNILSCCIPCNKAKRNRLPNYSGRRTHGDVRPLKAPKQPTTAELLRSGLEFLDPAIKEDFASWLYWSEELQA